MVHLPQRQPLSTTYELVPIGRVRSPVASVEEAPRQGRDAGTVAEVQILPQYAEALAGIERWARVRVTCWLHRASRDVLGVHPRGDPSSPLTGVFATRSPSRPNPLAVYTVDLLERRDTTLVVAGIDAVDGTPVVDIRPHVPRLDA